MRKFFGPMRDPLYSGSFAVLVAVALLSLALTYDPLRDASADGVASAPASTATSTSNPAATPQPAKTPGLNEILREARRKIDLAAIQELLVAYQQRTGTYPSTGGAVITLCAQDDDAGCTLLLSTSGLPTLDTQFQYWYASDGETFTLLTPVEFASQGSTCTIPIPREVDPELAYCLSGADPPR